MITKAINFATLKHIDQKRKASQLPYIVHPMEVMYILSNAQCETDVVLAGILHDTLEDTQTTEQEIENEFGENVLKLVKYQTENKSKTWKERKTAFVTELPTIPKSAKLAICADKLANVRSMRIDLKIMGNEVWNRFNESKEQIKWYYKTIVNILSNELSDYEMYKELKKEYENVFSDIEDIRE